MARILIIDDDEGIRKMLRDFLEEAGYEILEARSGESGMALYREHLPDLVIVDLFTPGLGGLGAIRALKCDNPSVKIIAISGTPAYLHLAVESGALHAFAKPFSMRELLGTVRDLLEAWTRTCS